MVPHLRNPQLQQRFSMREKRELPTLLARYGRDWWNRCVRPLSS